MELDIAQFKEAGGRGQRVSQLFLGVFTRDTQCRLKKNVM